jgi:DNA (cytosine-5)-methyltransferase 1
LVTKEDAPKILLPDGRVRLLSALEKFRLQGFDDEDYHKAAAVLNNTQLSKIMGNSVSVPVIAAIGQRIAAAYEGVPFIC